jgi:murein DD-endopeptidase MepM/ murein hydrolase activator NlpD
MKKNLIKEINQIKYFIRKLSLVEQISSSIPTNVLSAYNKIVDAVDNRFWTTKNDVIEALDLIKNTPQLSKLLDLFKNGESGYFSFEEMMNKEFDFTDYSDAKKITDKLNKFVGVKSSFRVGNILGIKTFSENFKIDIDLKKSDPYNTKVKIFSPVPIPAGLESNLGQKRSYEVHPGVDIPCPSGTEVRSPLPGVVELVNPDLNMYCGGAIDIKHDGGYWTRFCHIKKFNVKVGTKVKEGEVVGLSGGGLNDPGRGKSTGPHLHWTFKTKDINGTKLDGLSWIGKEIDIKK